MDLSKYQLRRDAQRDIWGVWCPLCKEWTWFVDATWALWHLRGILGAHSLQTKPVQQKLAFVGWRYQEGQA